MMRRARRWLLVASGAALAAWAAACADEAATTAAPVQANDAQVIDAGPAALDAAVHADDGDAEPLPVVGGRAAPPTFTQFSSGGHVCLTIATTTPASTIHFTTDGTAPTLASTVFTKPMGVWLGQTIRAIAVAPGMEPSAESATTNNIPSKGISNPVTASPSSGEYDAGINVTLAFFSPSNICYTLDGTTPRCAPGPILEYCSPVAPTPAPCGTTSMTFAGEPVTISPPPDGGSVVLKATTCNTRGPGEVTTSTYTFK